MFEPSIVLLALFFEKFHHQARPFETFHSVCERFCFMCNHLSFFSADASSIGLFRLFPVRRSSDSQLTPWRGSSKGQSRPRGSSKKVLNKILHSYAPFFISALAREISRDKNVDVDWSSNNDMDFSSATLSRNVVLIVSRYWRFICALSSLVPSGVK